MCFAQAGAIGAAAWLLAGAGADTALAAAALTLLAHSCSHSTDLAYGTINAGALTHCLKVGYPAHAPSCVGGGSGQGKA